MHTFEILSGLLMYTNNGVVGTGMRPRLEATSSARQTQHTLTTSPPQTSTRLAQSSRYEAVGRLVDHIAQLKGTPFTKSPGLALLDTGGITKLGHVYAQVVVHGFTCNGLRAGSQIILPICS